MHPLTVSRTLCVMLLTASLSFGKWESADSLDRPKADAFSAPKPVIPEYRLMMMRENAAFGNRIYMVGSIATFVSLGSFWTGFFMGNGFLTLGMLGMSGGIPLLGIGSGMIQDAALNSNPDARTAGGAGWPMYFAGLGAQVASIAVLVSSVHEDANGDLRIAAAPYFTSLGLLGGGQLLYYASWFQFSRRRAIGRMNIASSVSLTPTAYIAGNKVSPGANLIFRF